MVLPGQLFHTTQLSACLGLLASDWQGDRWRNRRGEVLSVEACKAGYMAKRTHCELADKCIANTCHA